jgi:hypothetical protein
MRSRQVDAALELGSELAARSPALSYPACSHSFGTHIFFECPLWNSENKIVKCLPCHCSAMHWQNSNWPVKSSCLRRSPNAQQLFTREQKLKAGPYVYFRCPELAMVLSINLHNSSEERNYY